LKSKGVILSSSLGTAPKSAGYLHHRSCRRNKQDNGRQIQRRAHQPGDTEEVVSINGLAETVIDISGKDLTIGHDLSMPTGTNKYSADATKMEGELDWEPTVSLEDGVTEVYNWVEAELNRTKQPAVADSDNE
jgi:UDP-glucose 4-epimerase